MKRRRVLEEVTLYLSGSVATQAISLVVAIVTRNFLGPLQMGVWTLLQVFVKYASYTSLGTMAASAREIPFYRGRGDEERAEKIKNVFFSYNLLTSVAASAALAAGAVLFRERMRPELFYGLLITTALLVLQRINNAQITLLRAHREFGLAANQMVVSALVNAVLMTALSYRFRIYGYLWGMCLSFLFNIAYLSWRHDFKLRWQLDRAIVRDLAVFGLPLVAVGFLNAVFISIDRILVGRFLGLAELGIYGVAVLGASYAAKFPNEIGVVLIPNFHQKMGESSRDADLRHYVVKAERAFSDTLPLMIGPACLAAAPFLRLVMPKFSSAAEPLVYLLLGSYFLGILQPYSAAVIAMRRHGWLLPALGAVCLLTFAANWTALSSGGSLATVALIATAALAARFAAYYWIAAPRLFSAREAWARFARCFLKFGYLVAVLALAFRIGWGAWVWLDVFVRALVFTLFYVPFLVRFNREFQMTAALQRKFFPARGAAS